MKRLHEGRGVEILHCRYDGHVFAYKQFVRVMFSNKICLGLMCSAVIGCVSIEKRLASADEQVRNEAEYELWDETKGKPDVGARVNAIKKIRNENLLFQIAMEKRSPEESAEAVMRLSEQALLMRVAKESGSEWSRMTVLKRLEDDQDLKEVILANRGTRIEEDACAKIKDKKLKQKLVEESNSMEIKKKYFLNSSDKINALSVFDFSSSAGIDACFDIVVEIPNDQKLLLTFYEKSCENLSLNQCRKLSRIVSIDSLSKRISALEESERMAQIDNWIAEGDFDRRISIVKQLASWTQMDLILKFLLAPVEHRFMFETPVSGHSNRELQYYQGLLLLLEKIDYKNYPLLKRNGVFSNGAGWRAIERVEEKWFQGQFK